MVLAQSWHLLKGRCHGDFAEFWSKLLKYLAKHFFANMKLLLEFLQGRMNYNLF